TRRCSAARSTWAAASRYGASGPSCATAASTPTATCCVATATDAPARDHRTSMTDTPALTDAATGTAARRDDAGRPADAGFDLASQPHAIVERDGVRYTLLGTAHVSRASVEAVRAAIATGAYDAVAVELDEQRLQ